MYRIIQLILFVELSLATKVDDVDLTPTHIDNSNFGSEMPAEQAKILNDMSWALRLALLNHTSRPKENDNENVIEEGGRRVRVEALELPAARRDTDSKAAEEAENYNNNIKMKLFRLMYETVRDSDIMVKRAELIKNYYSNSTAFEMGYLLGDITDKFNIMSDISVTQKRLNHEWKPIEHINAYEQIANLGIDIGHIIDMIKAAEKRAKGLNLRAEEDVKQTKKNDYAQYYVQKQLRAMSTKCSSAATTEEIPTTTKPNLKTTSTNKILNTSTKPKQKVTTAKKTLVEPRQIVVTARKALPKSIKKTKTKYTRY